MFASTPSPPYYAVIFTAKKSPNDEGYHETAAKLMALVQDQSGFLDFGEVKQLCAELGLGLDETQVKEMMDTMDVDNSGKIDFEEFFDWYIHEFT